MKYDDMDEIKKVTPKKFYQIRINQIVLMGVVIAAALLYFNFSIKELSISRGDILVSEVRHGDLDVVVEGYGNLRSDKQQLITASTPARVKEIVLKPGDRVERGSLIVKLENLELDQQLENAQQELVQMKANVRQLKLNHTREQLDEAAKLAELQAQFKAIVLKREAQEKLHKEGLVSKLAYNETLLTEAQLKTRMEILSEKKAQLKLVQKEAINIQNERVKQQEGRVELARTRLDKLNVRAEFSGVVQGLSIELGQGLSAGQEIAVVGSVEDLVALIRIPQSQAPLVAIGQLAQIDIRQKILVGNVSRIDPVVENASVVVEVSLPSPLPENTRPQLSVDAKIITETLLGVRYIERPADAKAGKKEALYLLNESMDKAELTEVQFGKLAGRFVEIKSGAKEKDIFIVSDLSNYKNASKYLSIQ